MASLTNAALVVAAFGFGFILIRWGVRGVLKVLKEIK
jgi:hypothetical protein